jgi:3-methyladenine DNA glycosylase/8-oxoguanine DNA glycosylase
VATTRRTLAEAAAVVGASDPVLRGLIERHGTPPARPHVAGSLRFAELARAIVYQQLAGAAAATIHGRLVAALGGTVTPEAVLAATPETLAACGLSRAKAASIRDLAAKVVAGEVALERIGRLPDEEVIDHLVQVRGIGRWTAEMFLIGPLGRLDVWPIGDLGVRVGYAHGWGMAEVPSPAELELLGERYRPYRSVVAWYCWRAVDERNAAR